MLALAPILRPLLAAGLILVSPAVQARAVPSPAPPLFADAAVEPLAFADLPGWREDDPRAALAAFRRSCGKIRSGSDLVDPARPVFTALKRTCRQAARLPARLSEARARAFFEREFRPLRVAPLTSDQGFLTGYYEPEVAGSRTRTDDYATPLYRRPPDLILEIPSQDGVPANRGKAFREENGVRVPYYDRAAIDDGALAGKGLEVAFIRDPADAFFAAIQGSVRVRLPDGRLLRLNYDGHNGQPYTPVGRILVEKGIVPREKMSMDAIRAYIAAHPEEGKALMRENHSYVFFRIADQLSDSDGAVGAQGLPLVAERSIAVDKRIHVYGTPIFLDAQLPLGADGASQPFRRLTIAQDTGSAIVGPARADIFFGAGAEAGSIAGRIKDPGNFAVLVPRSVDPFRPHPAPRPSRRPPGIDGQ
ncbi:MltA domain-containing protein [Ancylobacter sonchi]|uniref:murein transglycosylase A n=1 Tax=Ancylobacter sonchi TaxID=1937790 RepID=UPI0028A60C00|nr:MltA domain-containing protein [Ancylobacter sonchi]